MNKRTSQDLLIVLDTVRKLAKRLGSHTDVERVEARLAKFRAAEQEGDVSIDALFDETHKQWDQLILMAMETVAHAAAWERAAIIDGEVKARAAELRLSGARAPVRQAENEAARQHGFASGDALNKWLRRNRWTGQKISG